MAFSIYSANCDGQKTFLWPEYKNDFAKDIKCMYIIITCFQSVFHIVTKKMALRVQCSLALKTAPVLGTSLLWAVNLIPPVFGGWGEADYHWLHCCGDG